jgi:hypothetical protein
MNSTMLHLLVICKGLVLFTQETSGRNWARLPWSAFDNDKAQVMSFFILDVTFTWAAVSLLLWSLK